MKFLFPIASIFLATTIGCGNRDLSKRVSMMTVNDAANRLAEISGSPVRPYSTRDFGRDRFLEARSVIVPSSDSREILQKIRAKLPNNIIAFIGTTNWLGDEKHEDGVEIVIANGHSQFDILRVAMSDAVNYDMDTDALIRKLTEYDQKYEIDIFQAETDTIQFTFRKKLPDDLKDFCIDLEKFCPDIVDQGVGTVEALVHAVRETREVFLWWD